MCRQGKNHFDAGGWHDFVGPPKISWYYLWNSQNNRHKKLIHPIFPLTSTLGVLRVRGKSDICAIWMPYQHILLMSDIITSFESGYFKSPYSTVILPDINTFPSKVIIWMPLFFLKIHETDGDIKKKLIFSLAVPPPKIFPPKWPKIRNLFAFWRIRGIIVKKVERQGKAAKILCIEHNYLEKNFGGT